VLRWFAGNKILITELSLVLFSGISCSFYRIQKDKTLLLIIIFFLSEHGDSHAKEVVVGYDWNAVVTIYSIRLKDDFQSVLRSLTVLNICEPHTKECELTLFVENYVPYLRDLSNSFSNSFIDFYSCEVVSWSNMRNNEVLSLDRFASIMAVVFKLWIYFM